MWLRGQRLTRHLDIFHETFHLIKKKKNYKTDIRWIMMMVMILFSSSSLSRPAPGSKSEQRSQIAQAHVMMEMRYLCDMIWDCAEWRCPDGRAAITFGRLFKVRHTGVTSRILTDTLPTKYSCIKGIMTLVAVVFMCVLSGVVTDLEALAP